MSRKNGNIESMFMTKRFAPWYNIGERIEDALSSKEALERGGLNWKVQKKPIYTDGMIISGYNANVRESDNKILGVVSDKYTIVQNEDAFAFIDELLGEGVEFEMAGSLHKGKKVWILAKMPERHILEEKFTPYLVFQNTHDGSGSMRVSILPLRMMCQNIVNMPLHTDRKWSIRHIGDINNKLQNAQETLNLSNKYMDCVEEKLNVLSEEKLEEKQMSEFLNGLFSYPAETDSNKKLENVRTMRNEFLQCCQADDVVKYQGSKLGVMYAVTDLVTHLQPKRESENFQQNLFGKITDGHSIIDKSYQLLQKL